MIECDATFGHRFLQLPQAERVRYVPADERQGDFHRTILPYEYATQHFVHRLLISSQWPNPPSCPYCDGSEIIMPNRRITGSGIEAEPPAGAQV